MSSVKEPGYFSRLHVREHVRRTIPYLRSETAYLDLFAGATAAHKVVGESSTCYMRSEPDLRELKAFSGDPKIIALVRDPVLLISSYFHYLRFEGWEPLATLSEAWQVQDQRCAGNIVAGAANRPDSLAYRNVAQLGNQVERLFRIFGRNNVLILVADDLRSDPAGTARTVQEFLGLTQDAGIKMPHSNAARTSRFETLDVLTKRNSGTALAVKNAFKKLLGVRSLGIRRLVDNMNSIPLEHSVEPKLRDEMRAYFEQDVALLGSLIRRDLFDLWGWPAPRGLVAGSVQTRLTDSDDQSTATT